MGRRMPPLDLLQLDLTDECPLFCSHCSNSSGPRFTSALPFDAVESALLDAASLGCGEVILSGGEPLQYPPFGELLSLCNALGMKVTAFTTGIRDKATRLSISDLEWVELSRLGLRVAVFSAYGSPSSREFHNRVVRLRPVGANDAFEVNETGIAKAHEAGIAVELQFIPSDETCSELTDVSSWVATLQVRGVHLQYPTSQGRK
jgi:MoaA/NifB/PqqE/SkfB family radical SAM enzyme